MKWPKLREVREAVKALVVGPYTSKFPAVMPEVPETFRGLPQYHPDDCVGCGACFEVCPPRAITMRDDAQGRRRYLSIRHDNCITCGQCERYCITKKGITLTRRWNLVTNDRMALHDDVEKELVVCEREGCGEVVGAREHLLWIAERLGPLAFANPTLMLSKMQAMGLDEGVPSSERKPLARGDRIRILCPRCRQELSLEA